MNNKEPLSGKSLDELKEIVTTYNLPVFTAKQISEWIYKKRVRSIDEMTNISLKGRELLKEHYSIGLSDPIWRAESIDGTTKYLFKTEHGNIETVYIPEDDRATLCVSCQVGCKMNCLFCMTGKQGWSGNLTSSEITNQILSIPESAKLTNIVFMGMGEPFDNLLSILQTCKILTSSWGLGWSPHRITVSTVGVIPGMIQFIKETECHLAISLHNPIPSERAEIMPMEKKYSIIQVIDELKKYDWEHQRRVSFEYIMFEGINDTQRHATALIKLLKGLHCRINLIRFHKIPELAYCSPSDAKMISFRDYLSNNGIICTIRRSRGEDIMAACGLLSSNHKHE